jgi:3-methyladenine DNA glycosylase AlkC
MAEPFKNYVDRNAVERLASAISAVHPSFAKADFVRAATRGLEPLELKARVKHVAAALREALPAEWRAALAILVAVMPEAKPPEDGLNGGFWLWPVLQVVEDHGLDDPAASLAALRLMTPSFSAEFAIRPLIARAPEVAWPALRSWVTDPDPHVRRLVSEGSRPRLPWGARLQDSVSDPSRGLELLERLVDDPSPYVRRSVANHLGDVAKDHPDLAVALAKRWLDEAPSREELVRHGLRALLKAGRPDALALFGHDRVHVDVSDLAVTPRVRVGDKVEITAKLRAGEAAHVRVDVVWSWPGARGGWSSKTFRGADRELAAGETWEFRYRLPTKPVTTRPTRPGTHRITLRVLGHDVGPASFELLAP